MTNNFKHWKIYLKIRTMILKFKLWFLYFFTAWTFRSCYCPDEKRWMCTGSVNILKSVMHSTLHVMISSGFWQCTCPDISGDLRSLPGRWWAVPPSFTLTPTPDTMLLLRSSEITCNQGKHSAMFLYMWNDISIYI